MNSDFALMRQALEAFHPLLAEHPQEFSPEVRAEAPALIADALERLRLRKDLTVDEYRIVFFALSYSAEVLAKQLRSPFYSPSARGEMMLRHSEFLRVMGNIRSMLDSAGFPIRFPE